MDLSKELTREGVRGGREQFRWESLKTQSSRDRQQYLGYTTKLGVGGRFGKYDKNDWWRSGKSESSDKVALAAERAEIKRMEDEKMMQALGITPRVPVPPKPEAVANETIKKEEGHPNLSRPTHSSRDADEAEVHQVAGLGFRKHLKPSDWTEVEDVEENLEAKGEVLIAPGGNVKSETDSEKPLKRFFGPSRPSAIQIKEEDEVAFSNRSRSRSRSRPNRR
jgi:hypothetical protein